MKDLENKLLKAAEGYKGTANVKKQLIAEAKTDGLDDEEAAAIVDKVLKRLNKTETGKRGSTLGKAQNPYARVKRLSALIAGLRSW
jgi:hypothetical protein